MKLSHPFSEVLEMELRDPEIAVGYLNDILQDGDTELFLSALADVARAQGMTKLGRQNLSKSLSGSVDPRFSSVEAVLDAVGLRLEVRKKDKVA